MSDVDKFMSEFVRLKKRVEDLEKAAFSQASEYIEGWTNAAKLLGISNETAMKRAKVGEFPVPCRNDPFKRGDGQTYSKPTWRRADLVAYAEGR